MKTVFPDNWKYLSVKCENHCVTTYQWKSKLWQGTKFYVSKFFHFKTQNQECYANFTPPCFLATDKPDVWQVTDPLAGSAIIRSSNLGEVSQLHTPAYRTEDTNRNRLHPIFSKIKTWNKHFFHLPDLTKKLPSKLTPPPPIVTLPTLSHIHHQGLPAHLSIFCCNSEFAGF